MKKLAARFFSVLMALFVVMGIGIGSVAYAYNMNVDVNMSKSYHIMYQGRLYAQYIVGSWLPTDDVRARTSLSVKPYSLDFVYVSVWCKGISGGWDFKSNNGNGQNGNSWVRTSWTVGPNDDDYAEFVVHNFDGYTIRHY